MASRRRIVTAGGFTWDDRAGRYRDAAGRFVAQRDVRQAIDQTLASARDRVRDLGQRLRRGEILLDEWQRQMRLEVKRVHLWNAAAAKGGWAQMTNADFGRVGQIVRRQYAYLDRFALAIEQGLPLDGRFLTRSGMYVDAGRATYEVVNRLENEDRGATEERNVLGAAEHCAECLELWERGWAPLGSMPPPGSRLCRSHCHCRLEFR